MNMTKRERILVSVVLVLAVFCLYYIFFLKPNMDELKTVNSDIESKEELVTSVRQEKQILSSAEETISGNEEKISELSDGISVGFDQPVILVYLEDTVNEYAKKVTFSFSDERQIGQLNVCPAKITMTSSYDGIKSILSDFENGPYFIKVVSLNVMTDAKMESETDSASDNPDEQPATTVKTVTADKDDDLIVTISVEFYSQLGDLVEASGYGFADGYQYGGDIFH